MPIETSTPGVYIQELSLLPPSVAEVSTAIPAFIGRTTKGEGLKPTRISSLLEYESIFGGPPVIKVVITPGSNGTPSTYAPNRSDFDAQPMYHQVAMYFRNGGGLCYIVSVGDDFKKGLDALKAEDEPTLLLAPGAPTSLYNDILQHCKDRKDRFAILDAPLSREATGTLATTTSFRNSVTTALDYGAAYTPNLVTDMVIQDDWVEVEEDEVGNAANTPKGKLFDLKASSEDIDRRHYLGIKTLLTQKTLTLPPSGAIAGLYARIDRERGVWKAPANAGLIGVLEPAVKISDEEQMGLNVDANSGKSINAIRSFPGRGTLVWGARTLAGNSGEWKYVNVRRLFITVEESIQKATNFAVFEPNTASTWIKVKTMIEGYLYNLWQQGALAGSKPEQAYYVKVGLGVTMTPQDILDGIMRVDVGLAASRPAEFIHLRFSHKLQEA